MKKLDDNKYSLFQMAMIIDKWKQDFHIDNHHFIIFQNRELLTNIKFPPDYLHKNHSANRGFSNLPDTIQHPSEVWCKWKDPDPKKQHDVIRNYILFGENVNYVVTTESGTIKKAFAVVNSRLDRYRKGLIIFKA